MGGVANCERGIEAIVRHCRTPREPRALLRDVVELLRPVVPFDAACWHTTDPETGIFTAIGFEALQHGGFDEALRNELDEDDVIKFADVALSRPAVGIASVATGGEVRRSARFRHTLLAAGFDDELRAAFVDNGACWGSFALFRARGRPHFDAEDARLVGRLSAPVAEGLRVGLLARWSVDAGDRPGLVVLGPDDRPEIVDEAARVWLAELTDDADDFEPALPGVVRVLTARARSEEPVPPRLPVRTPGGRWLLLHATLLDGRADGRIGLIIDPAAPGQLAEQVLLAYGLTPRERDVTALVLRGLPTAEIGRRLHLSPWTVQDHLKVVFDKTGVRSRRALVARVARDHGATPDEAPPAT